MTAPVGEADALGAVGSAGVRDGVEVPDRIGVPDTDQHPLPWFRRPHPRRPARLPCRARRVVTPNAPLPAGRAAEPPAALGRGLAAIALALLDEDCTVWLGGPLAAMPRSPPGSRSTPACAPRTAGPPTSLSRTRATLPPLDSLAVGTDEAPHLSATVVLDVRGRAGTARFTARGPGIAGTATFAAPWAADGFLETWRRNTGLFPRGVDLLLVDADAITAVPRTTRLTAADPDREG